MGERHGNCTVPSVSFVHNAYKMTTFQPHVLKIQHIIKNSSASIQVLPNIFDNSTMVDFSCVWGGLIKKWVSDQVSAGVVDMGQMGS